MASESKLTGYCSQYQMAVLFYNYKSVSKVVSVWPENFKVSLILLNSIYASCIKHEELV
jgi:hypothetical protein